MTEKTDQELDAEQEAKDREYLSTMDADAQLFIRNAADMTEEGKLAIAEWLRHHAEDLLAEGHNYNFLFRGRYNPDPGTER